MNEWHVIIALPGLYALLSLGPWIALWIMERRLQRTTPRLVSLEGHLRVLTQAREERASVGPLPERPGRYQEPDCLAQQHFSSLEAALDDAACRWSRMALYAPSALSFLDVLSLRSWRLLRETLHFRRDVSVVQERLNEGEKALDALLGQERIAEEIPNEVRAELNQVHVAVRRLQAAIQAERRAGTPGLERVSLQLQETETQIRKALTSLALAGAAQMPEVVSESDAVLAASRRHVEEAGRWLDEAEAERNRAHELIQHVSARLRVAERRWRALKERGATESSFEQALASLRDRTDRLGEIAQQETREAYEQVKANGHELQLEMDAVSDLLEGLEDTMIRSRQAREGVERAVAQARATCAALANQDPPVDPEHYQVLLQRAIEAHAMAESHRGLGTREGYETAINLSQAAMQDLSEAREEARRLPEKAHTVCELLRNLSDEELAHWRERADRVRDHLGQYAQHWARYLASYASDVIYYLEQAETGLDRVSSDVRSQIRFPQSELDEAIEILSHAHDCMEKAKQVVSQLENEEQRLEGLRQDLEKRVEILATQVIPSMLKLRGRMLPELQRKVDALLEFLDEKVATIGNPANVDYDEATGEWLPTIERALEELRAQHEASINHYRHVLRETAHRIEKKWGRLLDYGLDRHLGLKDEVDGLAQELKAWRAEAEQQLDNPLALREMVDGRSTVLETRIEEIYRQGYEVVRRDTVDGREPDGDDTTHMIGPVDTVSDAPRQAEHPQIPTPVDEAATAPPLRADSVAGWAQPSAGESDPRYQQGMAHLQAGEWEKAVRCFEELTSVYPDSAPLWQALEDARLEARLHKTKRVRGRRWIIPWRGIGRSVLIVLIVASLGFVAFVGARAVRYQIIPAVAEVRMERQRAELLAEANAFLEAGEYDVAEARYQEILDQVPTHEDALRGVKECAAQRDLQDLYRQAVASQEAGEHEAAMTKLRQISAFSPGYRDVQQRMEEIERRQGLERLFAEAEEHYVAGRYAEALKKYQELAALDINYQAGWIAGRRYGAYMALGRELIEEDASTSEMVLVALEYFTQALVLKPSDSEAGLEQRLAQLFIQGQAQYHEGNWDEVVAWLRAAYDRRPDYLHGMVIEMLYDAYIRSGDAHQGAGDRRFALEQYQKAAELPVEDATLAQARVEAIAPTPTLPMSTPPPRPTPTRTPVAVTPGSEGAIRVLLAPDAERPVPPNIEIVLDASGSMWGRIKEEPKIYIATRVLGQLFDELPDGVNVALRVYGHQHHFSEDVCTDTDLLVPLAPLDSTRLMAQIKALNPQGETPIGYTLAQLSSDLAGAIGQSVVVLVSDGNETCEADPCKVAQELVAVELNVPVHIVGYAIDDPATADQLACIAEVTGGSYLPAGSAGQLVDALREAVTVEYFVYNYDGERVAHGTVGGAPISVPAGAYLVKVLTGSSVVTQTVVVDGDQQTELEVTTAGTLDVRGPSNWALLTPVFTPSPSIR